MRPVEESGDPGVDGAKSTHQIPDVCVLGSKCGRQLVEDERDVAGPPLQGDISPDVAEDALPDVAVGVHEPGEDDHPGGVDHLGAVDGQTGPDCGYPVLFDENVGFGEVSDLRGRARARSRP